MLTSSLLVIGINGDGKLLIKSNAIVRGHFFTRMLSTSEMVSYARALLE